METDQHGAECDPWPPDLTKEAVANVTSYATPYVERVLEEAEWPISKDALRAKLFEAIGFGAAEGHRLGHVTALAELRMDALPPNVAEALAIFEDGPPGEDGP